MNHRTDINPIIKAAVFHAQFETIHPFIDGNGRTGRALLHRIIMIEKIMNAVTLPVSAGLLHNIDDYMESIILYQNGNYFSIIEQLVKSLDIALAIGNLVIRDIEDIIEKWKTVITERATARIWEAIYVFVEQPVVDVKFLSGRLKLTERATRNLLGKLINYGIVKVNENKKRGIFYQAPEIISVFDYVSDLSILRRISAG